MPTRGALPRLRGRMRWDRRVFSVPALVGVYVLTRLDRCLKTGSQPWINLLKRARTEPVAASLARPVVTIEPALPERFSRILREKRLRCRRRGWLS